MKWFRFYHEVLHDSKVQTLSADMFRAWVNLLCLANEGDERGHLPDIKQIAFALRLKEDKAAQVLAHLVGCGLIDEEGDGTFRPHNWDNRQRNSDDVSNRVREHRRKKASVTPTKFVTLHETARKHDVTERVEESRGEERRAVPLTPSGGVAAAPLAPLPQGAEEAIEAARDRHGDKAAALVRAKAKLINDQLGGRYDLFLEALDAASRQSPPLVHVFSWCMTRATAKINTPPKAGFAGASKPVPPDRGAAAPGEAESKGCPHCSGIGQVAVYHPKPNPANRDPESITADCICPRGRLIRAGRDAAMVKRVPDLVDVLAGRSLWLPNPAFMEAG